MAIRVQFEGGEALARELEGLSTRLSRRVQRDALLAGAEPIQARARAIAPRDPGLPDMADNIGASTALGPSGEVAIAVGPTKDFFYGLWQEEGNSVHGASPFMRPALDSEAQGAIKIIGEHLWDGLRSRGRGLFSSRTSAGPVSGGPGSGIL